MVPQVKVLAAKPDNMIILTLTISLSPNPKPNPKP